MKFSANLSFMYTETEDILERYRRASKDGFKGVEIAFPYTVKKEEIANVLQETGMKQVLINTEPGSVAGYAGRVGDQDQFLTSLELSLEYCTALGTKLLHIMSGDKQEGISQEEVKSTLISNLKSALPLLKKAGVIGLLEPINPFSKANYNMDSYTLAEQIIRELNHPNLRLQLDIFHLQQIEGNASRRIKDLLPLVHHIQIAQVPERGEPDSAGELNYEYILDLLQKNNYEGWIGLEYKPVADTSRGLGWIQRFNYKL